MSSLQPSTQVAFGRDCEVTQIPVGTKLTIPRGTTAVVTQTLGGNVTLHVPSLGALVQLAAPEASALTIEGKPAEVVAAPSPAAVSGSQSLSEAVVWETLKTCYDPEIPVNIVDLGLIYDLRVTPAGEGKSRVDVKMTLTARGCGMGPHIAADAAAKLRELPGVADANVELVWDPPWNPEMISEEGRRRLGIG